ncbi:MAG: hypothetical protein V9E89_06045 [Ilumatobacteraceae bacterium]
MTPTTLVRSASAILSDHGALPPTEFISGTSAKAARSPSIRSVPASENVTLPFCSTRPRAGSCNGPASPLMVFRMAVAS